MRKKRDQKARNGHTGKKGAISSHTMDLIINIQEALGHIKGIARNVEHLRTMMERFDEIEKQYGIKKPALNPSTKAPIDAKATQLTETRSESIAELEVKIEKLESEKRRNNAILRKIPEADNETNADTYNLVKKLLAQNSRTQPGEIRRVYRLGGWQPGKTRAIVIEFNEVKDKWKLLRYSMNFKALGYCITDDLPPLQRARKNELLKKRREAINSGKKVKIKGDSLYVENALVSVSNRFVIT